MKTPKIDILKNTCSYSECSSLIYCALFHKNLGFIIVFSKEPFFEILYRGGRCNDDILSIMFHILTIWCHKIPILASFHSQRNRLSTNTLFLHNNCSDEVLPNSRPSLSDLKRPSNERNPLSNWTQCVAKIPKSETCLRIPKPMATAK